MQEQLFSQNEFRAERVSLKTWLVSAGEGAADAGARFFPEKKKCTLGCASNFMNGVPTITKMTFMPNGGTDRMGNPTVGSITQQVSWGARE